MGIFGDEKKDEIFGMALGVGGAFDNDMENDMSVAFGAALGASIASGEDWTVDDSIELGMMLGGMDDGE